MLEFSHDNSAKMQLSFVRKDDLSLEIWKPTTYHCLWYLFGRTLCPILFAIVKHRFSFVILASLT
jgi:hypothetical protein